MKVVCIREPNGPLHLEERQRPSPGPNEVLIQMRACGICHGDVVARMGGFPFVRFPIVPGHEIAGIVEEAGVQAEGFKPGDRVGLSVLFSSCGSCDHCRRGAENLCPEWIWTGMMVDGGYAELVLAKARYVVPLPSELDFAESAPLMCAGVTVYSGLKHAGCRGGQRVAVIALGGLGHLGVLFARALGARVAVLSSSLSKEPVARALGAELFIHLQEGNAARLLQQWDGGADVILATAPNVESVTDAFPGLAPDGTMVVVGVGPGNIQIDPIGLVMGRRRMLGSPAGSLQELSETLRLAAEHKIRSRVHKYPLAQAAEAFQAAESGKLAGRVVLVNES